eukprot:jgi/Chrzof1/8003/UNPLg00054.t1
MAEGVQLLDSKSLRELLKTKVNGVTRLKIGEVLLQCAAYRWIDEQQFEAAKKKAAKGKGAADIKALQYPEEKEDTSDSSVEVKRKRADVAERHAANKGSTVDVITCTWTALVKVEGWNIEEALRAVNKVAFEAYELANLHVLRLLRKKQPLPDLN